MNFDNQPDLIPYILSLAISTGVGLYALRRRVAGARPLALMALGEAAYTLGYIFELLGRDVTSKVFWDNFQFLGFFIFPTGALLFALAYTERRLAHPRRDAALLLALPLISLLLAYTDGLHHLIRPDSHIVAAPPFGELTYSFTPALYAMTLYIYVLLFAALGILMVSLFRSRLIFRAQALVVIVGVLIPVLGGILTLMDIDFLGHRDTTPFTFGASNLMVAWGLFAFRLLDMVPIARGKIFENMSDVVLVMDAANRIVDLNPAAEAMLGRRARAVVGQDVKQVYAAWPDLITKYEDVSEANDRITLPIGGTPRHFDLRITSMRDGRGIIIGRVAIARDVTAHQEAESALATYRDQLEQRVEERTGELQAANRRLLQEIAERQTAEEARRDSDKRARQLGEATFEGIAVTENGRIIDANQRLTEMLQCPYEKLIGRPVMEFIDPEHRDLVLEHIQQGFEKPYYHTMLRQDGSPFPVEVQGKMFQYQGKMARVTAIRDITERLRSEQALRESEERFRALVENSPTGIVMINNSFQVTYANTRQAELSGYSVDELTGMDFRELVAEADREEIADRYLRRQRGEDVPNYYEIDVRRKDGEIRRAQISVATARAPDGGYRSLGQFLDVTERHQVEEALRKSEAQLRAVLNSAPVIVFATDREGVFTLNEGTALALIGVEQRKNIGKSAFSLFGDLTLHESPDHLTPVRDVLRRVLDGETVSGIGQFGGHVFDAHYTPLVGANGQVQGLVGVAVNISERWRAEEALREGEERFRTLVENSPAGIYMGDDSFRFIYANQRLADLIGYSVDEIIGRDFRRFIAPEDLDRLLDIYERRRRGEDVPNQFEFDAVRKDGERRRMQVSVATVQLANGTIRSLGQILDVTERKRAEEALKGYAQHLETLHEIDQAILLAETPRAIAEAALVRLRQLIPSQRASVALFNLEEGYADILALNAERAQTGGEGTRLGLEPFHVPTLLRGEINVMKDLAKLKKPLPIYREFLSEGIASFLNIPLNIEDHLIGSLNIAASQPDAFRPEQIEFAQQVADQLAISIHAARLHEQVQRHADELERRVTERTAELSAANTHLAELSRVKDEFVANVSHELRTPITSIKLHLHLLETVPEKRDRYRETLRRETLRLEHLIEGLLTLSRLDQGQVDAIRVPTDLSRLMRSYVNDRTEVAAARGLTLRVGRAARLAIVPADPVLIGQALSILLTNALNYTPAEGTVTLSTALHRRGKRRWAGLTVADDGPGIPSIDQKQLFSRFYRGSVGTKSGIAGTGLGLAIAREIVDLHQGEIEVKSDPQHGPGAGFTLWLPVEPADSPSVSAA